MNSEAAFLTSGQTPGSRDDDPSVFANKRGSSLSQLPFFMFLKSDPRLCYALHQIVLVLDLWFWWGEAPKRGRLLV